MKKHLFSLFALLFANIMLSTSAASTTDYLHAYGTPIILNVSSTIDIKTGSTQYPKSPVRIPCIYQDDHTLYLLSGCEGSSIIIKDADNEEVFTFFITDETSFTIPSTLSGEYELHIHRGNYCFFGMIELS